MGPAGHDHDDESPSVKLREETRRNQETNGPSLPGLSRNQAFLFQRENHLVDRGWRDLEEPLQVSLSGSTAVHPTVGMNEREILTL